MSTPREFWINQSRCTGKAKAYDTLENTWGDTQHNDNIIHVIEHSAYVGAMEYNNVLQDKIALQSKIIEDLMGALGNAMPIGHSEECNNLPIEAGPAYCLHCEIEKTLASAQAKLKLIRGETK